MCVCVCVCVAVVVVCVLVCACDVRVVGLWLNCAETCVSTGCAGGGGLLLIHTPPVSFENMCRDMVTNTEDQLYGFEGDTYLHT